MDSLAVSDREEQVARLTMCNDIANIEKGGGNQE